ncbi:MAG: hypothetical protein WBL44_05220 [Nitrososphaeraceae archaeon]|jgi:hypothetical protein
MSINRCWNVVIDPLGGYYTFHKDSCLRIGFWNNLRLTQMTDKKNGLLITRGNTSNRYKSYVAHTILKQRLNVIPAYKRAITDKRLLLEERDRN